MGTFERIRKVSPYALGVFVVVFIGFMILSDADITTVMNQGDNPQTAPIGIVNGENLLYKDYEEKVRQQVEQQRAQQQDPEAEIDEAAIRTQVWDQMVGEILLKQEAKKAGIVVTDTEVSEQLLENPPEYLSRSFTDTAGRFNKTLYLELVTKPENIVKYMGKDPAQMPAEEKQEAINNFRKDLLMISDYLRIQKLNEALSSIVSTAGSQVSPLFAKTNYKDENSNANVSFIHVNINEVKPDDIKISDDEISKYYEANKQYYRIKNQRKIKFVNFPVVPSVDDSTRANLRVQKILTDLQKGTDLVSTDSIFEIKMSEYSGTTNDWKLFQDIDQMKAAYFSNAPERQVVGPVRLPDGIYFFRLDGRRTGENVVVKASHILVGFGANSNKDSARQEAEKIMKRVRGGEDFAKLATELSEDKGSAVQGGDLGFFGKNRMVKPFEDAAFSANIGQVVGPVETQFGYHIIKVTDKKSDELKFSEIKIVPSISNPTRNKLMMDAHSFVKQFEEGVSFDEMAKRLKINADTSDFIPKAYPIFNSWALTNQIFDAEIGAILQPKEIKNTGIIIVQVLDERKEGLAPLDAVKEEIKAKLLKKKQLDVLKERTNRIYNEVKAMGNLANVTTYEVRQAPELKNNGSIPGLGLDIAFTANVFKSPTGKILEPIRGENGWYIAQVNTKSVPDENTIKANYVQQSAKLKQVAKSQAFNSWYNKVKEKAEIEDLRGKYFTDF